MRTARVSHFVFRAFMLLIIITLFIPAGYSRGKGAAGKGEIIVLQAMEDFERIEIEGYVPKYRDSPRGVLAINSISYEDMFGAAETEWEGSGGRYNVTIRTMPEEDGECTYKLYINGRLAGEFVNPETDLDFGYAEHTWKRVRIRTGDTIRVTSNTHSNGLIPEGEGFAWARGRWSALVFESIR